MNGYRENAKIVVGDGDWFLKNCAVEFTEIVWACYHHPYASPLKCIGKWMHGF